MSPGFAKAEQGLAMDGFFRVDTRIERTNPTFAQRRNLRVSGT